MTPEPMVKILHARCSNCGRIADQEMTWTWEGAIVHSEPYPIVLSATEMRNMVKQETKCSREKGGCGELTQFLYATEPVR